ncbi:hydroxyisourate hydrolase [Acinetobacter rathckeae]|uniref:hydroxyisourate hydrolase n=1 Tax=Acinetobacter rathckeae TaxID=2605272 RepID=UPI0018A2B768|nr:hydroxyisourate hydrolase [Acinetobacter rathckeae]MBF7688238.1 hydroxyisourate hydrolase [Acinetobacter rathckeae]MBF7695244.1 hydroxyisourate hydrolase [Acinetobacter rathckeae]
MISTHILDTNRGKPASGVQVKLFDANTHSLIGQGITDTDGRLKDFNVGEHVFTEGAYQLEYDILPYFKALKQDTFFPKVCLQFYIANVTEHYHVPLLISPYAYSTYRGS